MCHNLHPRDAANPVLKMFYKVCAQDAHQNLPQNEDLVQSLCPRATTKSAFKTQTRIVAKDLWQSQHSRLMPKAAPSVYDKVWTQFPCQIMLLKLKICAKVRTQELQQSLHSRSMPTSAPKRCKKSAKKICAKVCFIELQQSLWLRSIPKSYPSTRSIPESEPKSCNKSCTQDPCQSMRPRAVTKSILKIHAKVCAQKLQQSLFSRSAPNSAP